MATSMLRRQTGNWANIFPNKQSTEQQSALFVKKLLAVSISNITYLRAIFPEHAFGDRCLEDVGLKILRDDSACPGACQVIQWVKGCFDALDKKYLRMIIIGIYADATNPNTVLETYTFRFDYNTKTGITIYRNERELVSAFSPAETRKATVQLLRTIVVLTQTLKPLPDDVMMTMKLFYYDDVTPEEYEPPGFKPTPADEEIEFKDEPVTIKVGDVSTAFHTVKLRIRTDSKQFDMVNAGPISETHNSQTQPTEMLPQDLTAQSEGSTVAIEPTDQAAPMNSTFEAGTSTSTEGEGEVEEESEVRCPCGCNEDDGLMVWCGECKVWQHAVCFGALLESEVPELHICEQCAQSSEGSVNAKSCTDPFLQFLNPVALQATTLWRRALSAILEFTRIPTQLLAKRLGVELSVAQGLINRMENEGYVKRKRQGKVVDKEKVLNEGIPKYFEKNKKSVSHPGSSANPGSVSSSANPGTVSSSANPGTGSSSANPGSGSSSANPGTGSSSANVEQVTEQASSLSITESSVAPRTRSSGSKKATPLLPQHITTDDVRRSPRLQLKRARSTVDQDVEFDLSQSQDQESVSRSQSKKRKKASVVAKSIVV